MTTTNLFEQQDPKTIIQYTRYYLHINIVRNDFVTTGTNNH